MARGLPGCPKSYAKPGMQLEADAASSTVTDELADAGARANACSNKPQAAKVLSASTWAAAAASAHLRWRQGTFVSR